MISNIYRIKNNTNECICKTETDSQCRNIVITREEWKEERNKVGQLLIVGTNHHLLKKNTNNILYSKGNYSHYFTITYNGI